WSAFSPAGNYAAVVRDNQEVQLWPITDTQNGHQSFILRHLVESKKLKLVTGVTFSPDGRWLATGARDGSIIFWSLASTPPSQAIRIQRFDDIITGMAFSPSGKWFAAGVWKPGDRVRIWDVTNPSQPRETASFAVKDHDQVASVAFSNDSTTLFIG